MRIHVLVSLLLALVINVFAAPKLELIKKLNPLLNIAKEDLELFSIPGGLWFLDDYGNFVQATLKFPMYLESLVISMDTHVLFNLYTRDLGNSSELLTLGDVQSLKNSSFDPKRQTKFVTHGWINSKDSRSCQLTKDSYLQIGDYNVIVVDWGKIAKKPYVWAAMHVIEVAKFVAKMIDFLEEQGIDLNTTTLSGHSLGAHVMGLAGYYAKNQVNYVVGLDPALPLFALAKIGSRISAEDAKQVEIIHTNAGLLGYLTSIGKADFFPNGGKKQLGCSVDLGGACSHARSYEFFAESIVSKVGFYGMKCKDYSSYQQGICEGEIGLMGGSKSYLPYSGNYYLETGSNYPYAKGKA